MSQTTVQRQNAIRFGSAKLEIGADIGSLVDFGAMRAVRILESWEERLVESDNAGTLDRGIRNQRVQVTGNWMEPDLELMNTLRGGIDTYGTVAGTPVAGAVQNVASGEWAVNETIEIENQMGDGSAPTINSVTGSVDGALTPDDDFDLVKLAGGKYAIVMQDVAAAANLTTTVQSLTVNYDYTPAASKTLSSGGKSTISPRVIRITNTNDAGKTWVMTIYKAYVTGPADWPWPSDDGEDALPMPLQITGEEDTTRSSGDQLYAIVDSQSTT